MAISTTTSFVPFWFTPKQPESDRPTRIKIKPLNGMERLDIAGELGAGRYASAQKIALRHGLIGWENLDDQNGDPVEFEAGNVKLLPVDTLAEIAEAIIRGATMDAEKTKN